jgi:allantoate deiminase
MMEHQVIERCRALAEYTEEPGWITRTFLSPPMHDVHAQVRGWMEAAGMQVAVDHAGNIRGAYGARTADAPRLYIGSHLDTVRHAGAFDGILGVVLGIALVESLRGKRFGFAIEVVGFSDEEGVRFGHPFLGSLAMIGELSADLLAVPDSKGVTVREAIGAFGLDPTRVGEAVAARDAIGYLEFHIEQGPMLEEIGAGVGVVDAIAGQSRLTMTFHGKANHAGTTPMNFRSDALAGAAQWIAAVERTALKTQGLVATVGRIEVQPDVENVIPGEARLSLDVRHADDEVRRSAVDILSGNARKMGARRGLSISAERLLDQPAVAMDPGLAGLLERAGATHHLTSGAGHDAMILARRMPAAMLFLRSPAGVSHHPDESVLPEDVAQALRVGSGFLEELEASRG